MRLVTAAVVFILWGNFPTISQAHASVYDSNVVQQLHLQGFQKTALEKVIGESRARRNHILRKHGIDPNAKPNMWRLMGVASELKANSTRERDAVKRILTPKQLRLYDAVIKQTRRRIMSSF
jgi:hypothetical protein